MKINLRAAECIKALQLFLNKAEISLIVKEREAFNYYCMENGGNIYGIPVMFLQCMPVQCRLTLVTSASGKNCSWARISAEETLQECPHDSNKPSCWYFQLLLAAISLLKHHRTLEQQVFLPPVKQEVQCENF